MLQPPFDMQPWPQRILPANVGARKFDPIDTVFFFWMFNQHGNKKYVIRCSCTLSLDSLYYTRGWLKAFIVSSVWTIYLDRCLVDDVIFSQFLECELKQKMGFCNWVH